MIRKITLAVGCVGATLLCGAHYRTGTARIEQHVQYLSADEMGGRLPGTPQEERAADYIREQFLRAGCQLLCNEGLQEFKVPAKSSSDTLLFLQGKNVVALIEGRTDQYIVLGAHYDHLGMGGPKSGSRMPDTLAVHNGADDNASGVAAMIECARKLAGRQADCGFILVAFSAEERGLIGSTYFVEHLPVPKEQIKAMINFDMVGRLDSTLTLHGTATALEFDSILTQVQQDREFVLVRNPGGYGPSDHTSFYAKKIPVLYFHTAIHEQYHTPFDDVELINHEGIATIVDFALEVIDLLAQEAQLLTYHETGGDQQSSRAGMNVTLGILPDHVANVDGLRVTAIKAGGAGMRCGLQKEDVIVGIQGVKVTGIESYMEQMSKLNRGEVIIIDVLRGEQKIILTTYL